ncbi:C45 family peptidase [Priestia koreensis]|uniref:C45 family peptidase n=1 Tax=Priestia koreensis TaxID=284581 RepID=UPI0028F6E07A|nr:C45 family peptidase [Priestia koreensis]
MKEIQIDVIQGKGSYYDLGLLEGTHHRDTPLYENHRKRRKRSLRSYETKMNEAKAYYDKFGPGIWDELRGLADGLGWTLEETVHEYSGYQAEWKKSGCSAMMQDGFYARNYDYHPKTYEGRFLLWKPENGYASIGFGTRMIGRMDGMNEKGLVIGYHFVNRRRQTDGFICCAIARFVLDTCATTEEAIDVISRVPHRQAFNYSVYDREGRGAIVEASGRGVHVTRGAALGCANHFDNMTEENRHHLVESKERMAHIDEQIGRSLTPYEAYERFNQKEYGIFKEDYKNSAGTLHTVVYVPATLQVLIGAGRNAKPLSLSFSKWLNDAPLLVKKIKGTFATDETFPFEEPLRF